MSGNERKHSPPALSVGQNKMITYRDCISILSEEEKSDALERFLSLANGRPSLVKSGGYRAIYDLKDEGVCIHMEYIDQTWKVRSLQLIGGNDEDASKFKEEIESGLKMSSTREEVHQSLGKPTAFGGNGKELRFGIINRFWDEWNRDTYSVRIDYQNDESSLYLVTLRES